MYSFDFPELCADPTEKSREEKSGMRLDNIRISFFCLRKCRSKLPFPKFGERIIGNQVKCGNNKDLIFRLCIGIKSILSNRKDDIEHFTLLFADKIARKLLSNGFYSTFVGWEIGEKLSNFHKQAGEINQSKSNYLNEKCNQIFYELLV